MTEPHLDHFSHAHLSPRWLSIQPVFALHCPYGLARSGEIVIKVLVVRYPRSLWGAVACNLCSGWRREQSPSRGRVVPLGTKLSFGNLAQWRKCFGRTIRPRISQPSPEQTSAPANDGSGASICRQSQLCSRASTRCFAVPNNQFGDAVLGLSSAVVRVGHG